MFKNDPSEWERTDWRLLQNSSVSLFMSDEVLVRTVNWLTGAGYRVVELDAQHWTDLHEATRAVGRAFDFPAYFGDNLNAFNDCLQDVATYEYGSEPATTGTALVIRHYDAYASRELDLAHAVLHYFAKAARTGALIGHRMMCLVQSDDPGLSFADVGATPVSRID